MVGHVEQGREAGEEDGVLVRRQVAGERVGGGRLRVELVAPVVGLHEHAGHLAHGHRVHAVDGGHGQAAVQLQVLAHGATARKELEAVLDRGLQGAAHGVARPRVEVGAVLPHRVPEPAGAGQVAGEQHLRPGGGHRVVLGGVVHELAGHELDDEGLDGLLAPGGHAEDDPRRRAGADPHREAGHGHLAPRELHHGGEAHPGLALAVQAHVGPALRRCEPAEGVGVGHAQGREAHDGEGPALVSGASGRRVGALLLRTQLGGRQQAQDQDGQGEGDGAHPGRTTSGNHGTSSQVVPSYGVA